MKRQGECEEYCVKVDIPLFSSNLLINEFLNWLSEVECCIDLMESPPNKMMKLAAYKFKSGAVV